MLKQKLGDPQSLEEICKATSSVEERLTTLITRINEVEGRLVFLEELDKQLKANPQCSHVFDRQPFTCSMEQAKVSYVAGLLRGRALNWAEAMLGNSGANSLLFTKFVDDLKKVFDHTVCTSVVAKRLLNICQDQRSVSAFSVEFRILAAESGWDDKGSKRSVFA